jgi:CxxC motif-containing protein (DUF1111 family)
MAATTKRGYGLVPALLCAFGGLASCSRHALTVDAGRGDASADLAGGDTPGSTETDAEPDGPVDEATDEAAEAPTDARMELPPDVGPIEDPCSPDSVAMLRERLRPLFSAGDVKNPPIVFKRADGVLVTRAADRFRGRHEKEGSFGQYLEYSFLDRTFGVTIEDFSVVGQQRLRVTYLPIYKPMPMGNRITNFRQWKVSGNNATFALNDYLVDVAVPPVMPTAPFGGVQQYDNVMRVPEGRALAAGETYEFEFGAFLPPGGGLRDSYYTETFRYRIGVGGLTPNNRDYDVLAGPLPAAQLGGDTTIAWLVAEPYLYFEQLALNVQHENVQSALEGRRLFFTNFATGEHLQAGNPPFPEQVGKAGPLYNEQSCEACHFRNGHGSLVNGVLGDKASVELKLFEGGVLGDQLQAQEGTGSVELVNAGTVVLSDGTRVVLRRPAITVAVKGLAVTRFSARVAPPLLGLGLLEAVDEGTFLSLGDRLDCDKDGVSGRVSLVKDPATGALRVGRFGWKADKVSVAQQVADEAAANLGVTTTLRPDEMGKVELSDADLAKLTTYLRLIGIPPQRKGADDEVVGGAQVFKAIGCAACHWMVLTTSPNHPFSELRAQTIHPYTDLLLHDMGPDLADNSGVPPPATVEAPASASEWRTPPLWGVGLAKTVNPDAGLLHDGRAADVQEAILWHGGEAMRSRDAFVALSADDRAALLAFLQSL